MSLRNKKILITFGPTWVDIDSVRVISNISSGHMGKTIIDELRRKGAKMTALQGPIAEPLKTKTGLTVKSFCYFEELKKLLSAELKHKKYDAVIHAAAVSDYKPVNRIKTKLSSDKQTLTLKLKKTPKLINSIKRLAPKTVLVGFKLEASAQKATLKKAALESVKTNRCDYVVANSVNKGYHGYLFNTSGSTIACANSRKTIAKHLVQTLGEIL